MDVRLGWVPATGRYSVMRNRSPNTKMVSKAILTYQKVMRQPWLLNKVIWDVVERTHDGLHIFSTRVTRDGLAT